ncbi:hypothetical protein [Sphingomonas hengshuiensis]|uniref:Uncharacterized protein n=1 Tax=Sphingomonas hengshuiensis TaxID=1609977 RepID=A0A7U4J9P1_9SPHN|nr:hypothetical protein [Sphingomonas hengshuiensis]AJP72798.1 hypothetical protein TS85_14965 [Sphingomonas hengshuiensis]
MSGQQKMQRSAKGKRPGFFDEPALDQMMSMILVLTSEMSVLGDRVDLMERAFAARGIDIATEMAALKLDQPALEARESRRQALLERLFYLMRKQADESIAQETADGYKAVIDEIAVS